MLGDGSGEMSGERGMGGARDEQAERLGFDDDVLGVIDKDWDLLCKNACQFIEKLSFVDV